MHPVFRSLLHYFYWVLCTILAIFLLFTARTSVLLLLRPLAETGWEGNAWALTIDKFFIIGAGIALLAFVIFAEAYLRKGKEKNFLFGRFARLFGFELLVLFLCHTIIAVSTTVSVAVLGLLGTEFISGSTLLVYSFRTLPPGKGKLSQLIQRFLQEW